MTQVINTNSLSLLTQNNLNKSQSALNSAIERLSSGMRINSAKDDAAGQAIANRFTANIKGLTQATRNANDGISIAQTTEGALTEVNNNLQRVRELSVQAATGTNSATDLDSIQSEIGQRLDEINRVSEQTQFNGVKVLSADAGKLTVQVGANDGETIDIDLQEISAKTLGLDGFNVNGKGSKNKAATSSDLLVAGFAAGTTANGVTALHPSLSTTRSATRRTMLADARTGGTVVVGSDLHVHATTSFSYWETGVPRWRDRSLTPPPGGSTTATVTIGGKSTGRQDRQQRRTDRCQRRFGSVPRCFQEPDEDRHRFHARALATADHDRHRHASTGDSIKVGATGATYKRHRCRNHLRRQRRNLGIGLTTSCSASSRRPAVPHRHRRRPATTRQLPAAH
jgi:flagellin